MARPPSSPALAGRSVAFVSFTSREPSVMASPPRECAAGTSGLYCGPRTRASEGPPESVSVGGGRRGPLRQRLAGLRRKRRRRRSYASRNPDPVVLGVSTVAVELPAPLRVVKDPVRLRSGGRRPSRRQRRRRQTRASRDPDPVIRRGLAVAIELPAPLLIYDAIGGNRYRRRRRRRRALRHHHRTARRGHDYGRSLLALEHAAAQRCNEQWRHHDDHLFAETTRHLLGRIVYAPPLMLFAPSLR